jgi:hypothetical protein
MLTSTALTLVLAWSCSLEQQRVRSHLDGAFTQLATMEPAGLTNTQRANRREALTVLREYIDRGRFPKNPGVGLTPIFVDAEGTRCAMGELMARLGGAELVERVRQTRNLATVGVLADEPGLLEWLDLHGLTPEEAALVQPGYQACGPERLHFVCGAADPRGWPASSGLARLAPDGGVDEVQRFEGTATPPPINVNRREPQWFAGTQYLWWRAGSSFRTIVKRGRDWVSPVDRDCGAAPTLTETEARELLTRSTRECVATLLARDPRWVLSTCGWYGFGWTDLRPLGDGLCDESGGVTPGIAQTRGAAEQWLEMAGFGDAGIDLSDYERWVTERPGPPVLEPITLDAPPALPLQAACAAMPSTAAAWLVVLLLKYRRR